MSIVEVKVPQLSESVSEATMLQWKKKPGEAVAQDEILIEIETDKVVLEVPAPSAGVLAQVIANDGDTVTADQVIAKIDTEGTAGAAAVHGYPARPCAGPYRPGSCGDHPGELCKGAGAGHFVTHRATRLVQGSALAAPRIVPGRPGRLTITAQAECECHS